MKFFIICIILFLLTACSNEVMNMATINQLSALDSLQGGDNIAVYDASNGDARKSSLTLLSEWLQSIWIYPATLKREPTFIDISTLPSSSTVTISTDGANYHFTLGGASVTLVALQLPGSADAADNQEVSVTATTALTQLQMLVGTGASVVGGGFLGAFAIADSVRFKYNLATTTWYRIELSVV